MAFDPENPHTGREFHPEQDSLNRITAELAAIESRDDLGEFPDPNAKETFLRSLKVAEEQLRNIIRKVG